MRVLRIYQAVPLMPGTEITLDARAQQHVIRVLRLKVGALLSLFNGNGEDFSATLLNEKTARVAILRSQTNTTESPLMIHLGQGISRSDKMDYAIQKAVELGVTRVTPLFTERCTVQLKDHRLEKRLLHWQQVAISACEQSGRAVLPQIDPPVSLIQWLHTSFTGTRLLLHPSSDMRIATLPTPSAIQLLIGPEGGLSATEITHATQQQFQLCALGPRILRTETAPLVAISLLQSQFGDL